MKHFKMFSILCTSALLLSSVSGSGGNSLESPSAYTSKPVLSLVETPKTATIYGTINNASFLEDTNAIVTVFIYNADVEKYEEHTMLEVPKTSTGDDTDFSIFWLIPGKAHRVEISAIDVPYVMRELPLEEGQVFGLNGGNPI